MTPGARLSAAIEVLDAAIDGAPVEKALTGWARRSRFAGSGDRAAVRDIVYDAWRCRRSFAALGGGETGRGLVIGGLRARGEDLSSMNGDGHAPEPPDASESGRAPAPGGEALDIPDWIWPRWQQDLGSAAEAAARAARFRAPVFLRVNLARGTREAAIDVLAAEDITAVAHPDVKTALEVVGNERKIARSAAYLSGLVELQDASSQAAVAALPLTDGMRVLDYCAGGGGKALAMADRARIEIWAYDAVPARLKDIPARAERAGVHIDIVADGPEALAPFDLVLVDAPCSGSGTWRRDPEGKWRLTPERLSGLIDLQAKILDAAQGCVSPDGLLAYATCSVFAVETTEQIEAFLGRYGGWRIISQECWIPGAEGDGFSLAVLQRAKVHNL